MSHIKISHELYEKLLQLAEDAEDSGLIDGLKGAYSKHHDPAAETKEGGVLATASIDDPVDPPSDDTGLIGGRPDDRH